MEPVIINQDDVSNVIINVEDPVLLAVRLPGFEDASRAILCLDRDSKNRQEFARAVAHNYLGP